MTRDEAKANLVDAAMENARLTLVSYCDGQVHAVLAKQQIVFVFVPRIAEALYEHETITYERANRLLEENVRLFPRHYFETEPKEGGRAPRMVSRGKIEQTAKEMRKELEL